MLQWNIDNQAPFTYFTTHVIKQEILSLLQIGVMNITS